MKRAVRVGGLVFLATMLVAAYNFFVLGPRTETEAHKAVCAGRTGRCAPAQVRLFRTPFWQDLRYRVGGRHEVMSVLPDKVSQDRKSVV